MEFPKNTNNKRTSHSVAIVMFIISVVVNKGVGIVGVGVGGLAPLPL